MSWEKKRIGEICEFKYGKNLPKGLRNKGTVPVYSSAGHIDFHDKAHTTAPGIIVGRKGSIGTVYFTDEDYFPIDTCYYIEPDEDVYDIKFLYYNLKGIGLDRLNTDAAVPGLNRENAYSQTIDIPDLPIQQRIANILSTYDDLIENNLKRIKLLEEAAQNIYREWFVHFRFPGYETASWYVDDKGRRLPEGWRWSTFYEEVDIMSGGTPRTTEPLYWNGEIPFFTPTDASAINHLYINSTEKTITDTGLLNCNSQLYPKDTVFVTARGTVGKVRMAMRPMAMNQSCYALKMKNGDSQFLLLAMTLDSILQLKQSAVGGVFDTIVVDTFKLIPIIVPNATIMEKFHMASQTLMNQTASLYSQIIILKEARDILLPRLMNRTIEL